MNGTYRPLVTGLGWHYTGLDVSDGPNVDLVSPDPVWAAAGARVVARLAAALPGQGVDVQHIGSTSVPGLVAKPVIDVQVGVRTLAAAIFSPPREAEHVCLPTPRAGAGVKAVGR